MLQGSGGTCRLRWGVRWVQHGGVSLEGRAEGSEKEAQCPRGGRLKLWFRFTEIGFGLESVMGALFDATEAESRRRLLISTKLGWGWAMLWPSSAKFGLVRTSLGEPLVTLPPTRHTQQAEMFLSAFSREASVSGRSSGGGHRQARLESGQGPVPPARSCCESVGHEHVATVTRFRLSCESVPPATGSGL